MAILHRLLASIRILLLVLAAWAGQVAIAVAETRPGADQPDTGKSYVMPYAIVLLAIALGLIVVCRSSNRSSESKARDDD
jgi:hypothetical protein